METAIRGSREIICPILLLNYPDGLAACCIPGECSAWRPDADADPEADGPARGRCAIIDAAGPED